MTSRKERARQPQVIVARPTGFCFGVERAIKLAKQGKERHGRVCTLGELVHNPQVLAELEREGIHAVRKPEDAQGSALVIRAHGCPPAILKRCERLQLRLIDATCPYVRKVQNVVRNLRQDGYAVVVVGERNHPEVRAILGHGGNKARVYSPRMRRLPGRKVGVVCQTTLSRRQLEEAVANLGRLRYTELRFFDTICGEVISRQGAAERVAHKTDLVIVVGGRNSANTSRLADIVRTAGTQMVFVENAQELVTDMLRGVTRIGVVAGSSTPAWVVEEVVRFIHSFGTVLKDRPYKEDRSND